MSTKAIRRIHEILNNLPPFVKLPKDAADALNAALAEVEAIEKASWAIAIEGHGKVGDNPQYRAWADAMSTMQAIAEEVTK